MSAANASLLPPFDPLAAPPAITGLVLVVLPVIIVVSLVGNAITVVLSVRVPALRNRLTPFIINIAGCNLAIALLPATGYLVEVAARRWPLGAAFCYAAVVVEYSAVTSCNLCLVAVAVERCLSVFKPLVRRSKRSVTWSVAGAWLLAVLLGGGFVALEDPYSPQLDGAFYCKDAWVFSATPGKYHVVYAVVFFLVMYVLPSLLMATIYVSVARRLWFRARPGEALPSGSFQAKEMRRKKRTVLLLVATVVLFQCCWLPSYIQEMLLVNSFERQWNTTQVHAINFVANMTGYLFGGLNPWLFPLFNKGYRKAYMALWRGLVTQVRHRTGSYGTFSSCASLPGIALDKKAPKLTTVITRNLSEHAA